MGDTSWLQSLSQSVFSAMSNMGAYPLVNVRSAVDGNYYRVRDLPDKQQAADLLGTVRQRMQQLFNYLTVTFPQKPQVKQLVQNFKPDPSRIFEATPDAEHTSYSVNKGQEVHLCLRQRGGQDESLVNVNVMMFVALHEMAHMITATIGHGPDFWNNFAWLLKQAEEKGLYKPTNFKAHPVSYCGVRITDAPTYNESLDGQNFTVGQIS